MLCTAHSVLRSTALGWSLQVSFCVVLLDLSEPASPKEDPVPGLPCAICRAHCIKQHAVLESANEQPVCCL